MFACLCETAESHEGQSQQGGKHDRGSANGLRGQVDGAGGMAWVGGAC
jgi:hypothetical protein